MQISDIAFINLDIYFDTVNKIAFSLFGINIAWYGILTALAVFFGTFIWVIEGKRQGQDRQFWLNFASIIVPICVISARCFYVIFTWDEDSRLLDFINFRDGGLGIFGVIIVAQLGAILYSKYFKVSVLKFMDIGNLGLIAGHLIGRWGNFFNREAFGSYTDNIFAMRLRVDQINQQGVISQEMIDNLVTIDGIAFIQVHPTFLYESMFLTGLLLVLWLYRKHKRFDGELTAYYYIGYGLFRSFIETLRMDPLPFFGFPLGASSLVALVIAGVGFVLLIRGYSNKLGCKVEGQTATVVSSLENASIKQVAKVGKGVSKPSKKGKKKSKRK